MVSKWELDWIYDKKLKLSTIWQVEKNKWKRPNTSTSLVAPWLISLRTRTEETIFASLRDNLNEEADDQHDESDYESNESETASISTSKALIRVRELQSYFTKLKNARQEDFLHLSFMKTFLIKQFSTPPILQ